MLHLILGRAGSGKTTWARDFLASADKDERVEGHPRKILIVPEQYSFESERAMLQRMGARRAPAVLVTSFSRLADLVFRRYGGIAGHRLNEGGRAILMRLAFDSVQDQLGFYKQARHTAEITKLMLATVSELKMCAITPADLQKAADQVQGGALKQKLTEMSLLFSAYEALVAQSYLDPLDDLSRMEKILETQDFFKGCVVVLDSFTGLTVQEMKIMKRILRQADDVYLTLCADQLNDPEAGMGLFSAVKKTARRMIRMAREEQMPVSPPVMLQAGRRFRTESLAALETHLFRGGVLPAQAHSKGIELYHAEDLYEEADYAAARIRQLVIEKGYRYRDFVVVMRAPDLYRGSLDMAFGRREIPFFMDRPRAVCAEPLMSLVLGSFEIVRTSFSSDVIFSFLKTGLSGFSAEEISLLENYTYTWNLSGKAWCSPWSANPEGFQGEKTAETEKQLQRLNALRERVVTPVLEFQRRIANADGEGMARAVYLLLTRLRVEKQLPDFCARLESAGYTEEAREQLRLWDLLMNVLDQTALVLHGKELPSQKYAELLRMVIETQDIAHIPQGLDEVTVGAADRMRTDAPKIVFILGAVRGEFPLAPSAAGIFSDGERHTLIALGLPLGRTLEEASVEERFIAYHAAAMASERLYLSWAQRGGEEIVYPSELVTQTKKLFPSLREQTREDLSVATWANSMESAFAMLARTWRETTPQAAALRTFFAENALYAPKKEALARAGKEQPVQIREPATARALFGEGQAFSPTQIETYHLCPFRYFCRYGLGVKERRPAEIGSLEYGSLMHYLLEAIFTAKDSAQITAMTAEERKALVAAQIRAYADHYLGGLADKSKRFLARLDRLAEVACVLVLHVAQELRQSRFQPESFELQLGEGATPALRIPLSDGTVATVGGVIDRVDIMEDQGVQYVRVVDYKTGRKEFKLSDVLYGINLQMLVYLAALVESRGAVPAGVLYMPSIRPQVSAARDAAPAAIEKEVEKELRMKGVVLEDETAICGMDEAGGGRYIAAQVKEIGKNKEYMLTREQFDAVIHYIKNKISQMTERLFLGKIDPVPLLKNDRGCDFCPYFSVCAREYGEEDVIEEKWSRPQVLEFMQREAGEENGGA